jgi:acyl-coenzyme A thioesterase PaaI-like protein
MTETLAPLRREARLAAAPAAASVLLEPVMGEAAGPGAALVSLSLDFGATPPADAPVVVEAWVERATRTLIFVHGRIVASAESALVVTASAVYRRSTTG